MNNEQTSEMNKHSGTELKAYLQSLITTNSTTLEAIATALIRSGGRAVKRESTFFTFEDLHGFRFRVYRAPPTASSAMPNEIPVAPKSISRASPDDSNRCETVIYLIFITTADDTTFAYLGNTGALNRRLLSHEREDILPNAKNAAEIYTKANEHKSLMRIAALDMCYDKRIVASLRASWLQHLLAAGIQIPAIKRMPKAAYEYGGPELTTQAQALAIQSAAIASSISIKEAIEGNLSATDLHLRLLTYKG
jgi:hypothetical protein